MIRNIVILEEERLSAKRLIRLLNLIRPQILIDAIFINIADKSIYFSEITLAFYSNDLFLSISNDSSLTKLSINFFLTISESESIDKNGLRSSSSSKSARI